MSRAPLQGLTGVTVYFGKDEDSDAVEFECDECFFLDVEGNWIGLAIDKQIQYSIPREQMLMIEYHFDEEAELESVAVPDKLDS